MFVYPGSPAQLACGAIVCFLFLLLNIGFAPYCTDNLNSLASFSLICQFLTLFVGIMISLLAAQGEANSKVGQHDKNVLSVLIVVVNCTTVAWPLVRKILTNRHKVCVFQSVSMFALPSVVVSGFRSTDFWAVCVCVWSGLCGPRPAFSFASWSDVQALHEMLHWT